MKYLLAILISMNAEASNKALIELYNGEQVVMDLAPKTKVSDPASVLWMESKDGPIPKDAPIGYADRMEDKPTGKVLLVENPIKKAAFDKVMAEKLEKEKAAAEVKSIALKVDSMQALSADEQAKFLKALKDRSGL